MNDDDLPSGLPMTWRRLRMSYPHRRRFALRKGRRLPCPTFRASPLTQQKLDKVYDRCLNEQMDQIAKLVR
jgi:hypothetical protein